MDAKDVKEALKDKGLKKMFAQEIINRMSNKDKEKAVQKFKEKYKDHPEYEKLMERFKKDIKFQNGKK